MIARFHLSIALISLLLIFTGTDGKSAWAGPYVFPPGIPPLVGPAPGDPGSSFQVPAIGSLFVPPTELPETVGIPFWSQWEIGIAHPGGFPPGDASNWFITDPAFIQDTPGPDHINFKIDLNFVSPPLGIGDLWVIFDANPWTAGPIGLRLDPENPFFLTPQFDPFLPATYGYAVILTDSLGIVADLIDPIIVLGATDSSGLPITRNIPRRRCGPDDGASDPGDECGPGGSTSRLFPPGTPVPEPSSLLLFLSSLIGLGLYVPRRTKRTSAQEDPQDIWRVGDDRAWPGES